MTADVLCDVIRDAFTGGSPPDASEIVPEYGYVHLENDEIRDAFGGKAWDELQISTLTYHREALFFFTPRGWSYYLPAYMQAIVTHYDETDTMVDVLLATITPSRRVDREVRRRERVAELNDQQLAALRKFIDWVANKHPDDLEDENRQAICASLR
jgi:hypothetical protein